MSHWDFGQPADRRETPSPLPARRPGPPPLLFGDGTATAGTRAAAPAAAAAGSSPTGTWAAAADPAEGDMPWTDDYWDSPEGSAGDDGWAAEDAWPAEDDWPAEDARPGEGTAPYPITYERPADDYPAGTGRVPAQIRGRQAAADWPGPEDWDPVRRAGRPGRFPAAGTRGRRVLLLAAACIVAAGAGACIAVLTRGHPAAHGTPQGQPGGVFAVPPAMTGPPSAGTGAAPGGTGSASAVAAGGAPLTMPQAQAVLAAYTKAKNGADAERGGTLLGAAETGSSHAIDAGFYREQRETGAGPVPAYGPLRTTYYIPRGEPAGGPRWFVVEVANAFSASPHTVSSTEYLLFTQATPGGGWRDAVEPYLLSGADAPRLAVGSDGYATAVAPDAAALTGMPGRLPALTAASLDGTGTGPAAPGNLSDLADERYWRAKLPAARITDRHSVTSGAEGRVHALATVGGGALVFYTDAAELTITPPAGTRLHLTVPGFYAKARSLSRAAVSYLEQFAVYDPPANGGTAAASVRVIADYAGITGKN
jgi:hypothetical protein